MKTCPACGHDGEGIVEFTTGGLREKCPRLECGAAWGAVAQQAPVVALVPAVVPVKGKRAPKARPETFDVVKAAKARLREVKRQLKALRELEKERTQLERLLAAAERPLAEVKSLRASS